VAGVESARIVAWFVRGVGHGMLKENWFKVVEVNSKLQIDLSSFKLYFKISKASKLQSFSKSFKASKKAST
jgi:hypothetical protein